MLATVVSSAPFDFDAAWRRADAAIAGRHPKTAARELSQIEGEAVARHRWAEAVRCAVRRMEVSRRLENVPASDLLSVYSAFADAAPEPMRPALLAILAHRYWEAYREAHPLVGPRDTLLEDDEGDDPARWSPERAASEVRRRFDAALAFADELKRVPASDYADLLAPFPDGDAALPTLFDRIALDAIAFERLFLDEKPLDAAGCALDTAAVFCAHPPEKGQDDPASRAVRLYQALLSFHERDRDRQAFEEIDFSRLQFGYAASRPGEVRERRYADALEQLSAHARRYEVASRAAALRAQLAVADKKPGLAHLIASRGAAAHPDGPGGKLCAGLVWELEQPSFSLETERVWCEPWPEINVRYRNLREVVFSLYPVSFDQARALSEGTLTWRRMLAGGFGEKPAKAWTQPLPPGSDYQERTFAFTAPKTLPKGIYALVATPGHPFNGQDAPVLGELVCVSDLVLLTAPSLPSGEQRGYVLRAKDGAPVAGAEVEVWKMDRGKRRSEKIAVLRTASDGAFSFKGLAADYLFRATASGGVSVTWVSVAVTRTEPKKNRERISLFTDRAAYKPGQSIHVAGVVSRAVGQGWQAVTNRSVTVNLTGPDTGNVCSETLRTDAFGTFRCSFATPRSEKDAVLRIEAGKHAERRVRLQVSRRRASGLHAGELSIDEEVKRFKEGLQWQSSLTVPRWLPSDTPVPFRLAVSTRAGKPVAARGSLRLYALKRPLGIARPESDAPDADLFTEWEDGEELATQTVAATPGGEASGSVSLKPGVYRFRFETTDPARNRVTDEAAFCVFDPSASRFPVPVADYVAFSGASVRPGQTLRVFWGTGHERGRCLFSVYDGATLLSETWSREGTTQELLEIPVTAAMHGPLVVNTSFLYGNRFYSRRQTFPIERPDAVLNLSLSRFNERPLPGGEEKWAFSVTDASGAPCPAEIVSFLVSEEETANLAAYLDNLPSRRDAASPWKWQGGHIPVPVRRGAFHEFQNLSMDAFRTEVWREDVVSPWKRPFLFFRRLSAQRRPASEETPLRVRRDRQRERTEGALTEASPEALVHPLPALQGGLERETVFSFTASSESGRWRLLAFAHDAALRIGRCEVSGIETVKPLSISLSPPAFLREGDEAVCPGVVQNNTAETQTVRLLRNSGDAPSGGPGREETLSAGESRPFTMKLRTGEPGRLAYRAVAKNGTREDVAEGVVPVLSALGVAEASRVVCVPGCASQDLEFNPLLVSDESDTLRSRALSIRVFSSCRAVARLVLSRLAEDTGDASAEACAARSFACAVLHILETGDRKTKSPGETAALRALAKCRASGGKWAWFPGGEANGEVSHEVEAILARLNIIREGRGDSSVKADPERWLASKGGTGWGSPGNSVAAVCALLLSEEGETGNEPQVEVRAGGRAVEWTVATNGMKECIFPAGEATSDLALMTIQNRSTNRCWLEVEWRYDEDARKLSAGDGTLAVRRNLFIRTPAARGGTLISFRGEAETGMEIVTRIELESDRPRSRLCLTEGRPACLEPVSEENGWKMRKGVRYYKVTGKSETRFYIENLPKGTFVVETAGRVTAQGVFHGGELHVDGIRLPGIPFLIREPSR